jgi:CheY-like chemotaxis protein
MPRLDGFQLIARIRREATLRGLPIVVLSSRPSQGSLPAGAVTPSPDGFRTRWTTYRIS